MTASEISMAGSYDYRLVEIPVWFVPLWLALRSRQKGAGSTPRKTLRACAMGGATFVLQASVMAAAISPPTASAPRYLSNAVDVSAFTIAAVAGAAILVLGLAMLILLVSRRHREDQQLLNAFLEHVPEYVYFKDRSSRFLRINRAQAARFGFADPAQAVNKTDFDVFTSEHAQEAFDDEKEILRTGQPIVDKKEKETWPDGHETWVLTTKLPLRDREGQIVGTMGISHDVTRRHFLEQELEEYKVNLEKLVEARTAELMRANEERFAAQALELESNRRHRQIVESSFDAFTGMDAEDKITDWNTQAEATFGWTRSEAIGQSFVNLIIPEREREARVRDRVGAIQEFQRRHAAGEIPVMNKRLEATALHKDGHVFPVELSFFLVPADDNPIFGAFARDITGRLQAQQKLARSEEQFRQLAENVREVFFVLELEPTRVAYINPAYEEIWGRSREELYNDAAVWIESVHPEDRDRTLKVFQESAKQAATSLEYRIVRPDGAIRWISHRNFLVRDAEGNALRVVGVAEDITRRVEKKEALKEAHDKLGAALRKAEEYARETARITELADMLEACQTVEEACKIAATMLPAILSCPSGALCLTSPSKDLIEVVSYWGDEVATAPAFAPNQCWCVRRGKIHLGKQPGSALWCAHVDKSAAGSHLCLPLVAQGESLGVLYMELPSQAGLTAVSRDDWMANVTRRASAVGERISLALANLRLREVLRHQSTRDPLTGLFNRRYMEVTLDRELQRAARNNQSLAVLMIDIDRFKDFNDTYGHQAGDAFLQAVGGFLNQGIRGEDIACRFGGEEFLLILINTSLDVARDRAQFLCDEVTSLAVPHLGQKLDKVTISVGVAVFPNHGTSPEELIRSSDRALYKAKAEGRNRVVMA